MENREEETVPVEDTKDTNAEGDSLLPPPTARESKILTEIYQKKYEEGDAGKWEALRDLQNVFDELHYEKVISKPMNLLSPEKELQETVQNKKPTKAPMFKEALTPRSTLKFKKPRIVEVASEQALAKGDQLNVKSASVPTLFLQKSFRPKAPEVEESQTTAIAVNNPIIIRDADLETTAFRMVQEDLEMSTYSDTEIEEKDNSTETERDTNSARQEIEVQSWKGDLNKLTRLRTASNKMLHYVEERDMETLQLKYKPPIWPHQQLLHQILSKMPTLSCLVLDGSELQCLRDLGSSFPYLVTLSVARCCLSSLDGTMAFPYLRTLIASNNVLQHAVQCSFLTELGHLDLSSNPIQDITLFAHLKVCKKLRSLKLYSTPVASIPDFYPHLKYLLPQVKELHPFANYTHNLWNKTVVKEEELVEEDRRRKIMQQEFDVIYQKNFSKFKGPASSGNIKGEMKSTPCENGGAITDASFENLLMRSFGPAPTTAENASSDSYVTTEVTVEEGERELGSVAGDYTEDFLSPDDQDHSQSQDDEDASSSWENEN